MIGIEIGIFLVKLVGKVYKTLFVRNNNMTVRGQVMTFSGKGLNFPSGTKPGFPTELLGANATNPAKITLSAVSATLLSATTETQARQVSLARRRIYQGLDMIEHFIGAGSFSFNIGPSSASGGTTVGVVVDGRVGVFRISSGTTATVNARAALGFGTSDNVLNAAVTPILFLCEATPAVSLYSPGNPGVINIGFADTDGTGLPTDSATFRSDDGGQWQAQTRRNNVTTTVNLGLNLALNDWHQYGIILTDTYAEFYYDGVLVATITTNLPGGAGRETGLCSTTRKTAAHTVEGAVDFDYYRLIISENPSIAQ